MKKATLVILALAMLLPIAAMAQSATANGNLLVSANVVNTIYLSFENVTGSGFQLPVTGTNAATMDFGTVSALSGTVPGGVTKTVVASPAGFTLSTSFGVKVAQYNAATANGYSLTAALVNPDSGGNTWTVDTVPLSTTAKPINGGTQAQYNNPVLHSFGLTIPATEAAGPISNTITLVATAL